MTEPKKSNIRRSRKSDEARGAAVRATAMETTTMAAAAMVSPDKPLTEKQRAYAVARARGESVPNAMAIAGYNEQVSYGYRLDKMPNVQRLIQQEQVLYAEAAQMDRKKVIDMQLEAYELARTMAEPATMVSAAREIGKICGPQLVVPLTNARYALTTVGRMPSGELERIEILRGPASALYGADAIGGVIQIFTRTGAPGVTANAFAGYGTYNTWQANAGLSGGNEQWRFRIEGNHESSAGFSAQKDASNRDADKDGYRNSGGGVSLSFLPATGHELGFKFRQNTGTTHYDSGGTPADGNFDDRVDFETQQWQVFTRNRLTEAWTSKLLYGETLDDQNSYSSWAPEGDRLRTINRQTTWQNDIKLPLGVALLALEHLEQTASPEEYYATSPEQNTDSLIAGCC